MFKSSRTDAKYIFHPELPSEGEFVFYFIGSPEVTRYQKHSNNYHPRKLPQIAQGCILNLDKSFSKNSYLLKRLTIFARSSILYV